MVNLVPALGASAGKPPPAWQIRALAASPCHPNHGLSAAHARCARPLPNWWRRLRLPRGRRHGCDGGAVPSYRLHSCRARGVPEAALRRPPRRRHGAGRRAKRGLNWRWAWWAWICFSSLPDSRPDAVTLCRSSPTAVALPSLREARRLGALVCPVSLRTSLPVSRSHRRIDISKPHSPRALAGSL